MCNIDISEIKDIESEAGIIATLIFNPDFIFYSEFLKPRYFSDEANAYMYYAIGQLAKRGVTKIDAYNITSILNSKESTKKCTDVLSVSAINDLIDLGSVIARNSVDEYRILVDNVLGMAKRRFLLKKLKECEKLCGNLKQSDIEHTVSTQIDSVMTEFSSVKDIPQYRDVVDNYWDEICERQKNGSSGMPFKFPALNEYVTIEPGELVIFAAEAKQGKSMMLLNCAVDLLRQGKSVLYIDSELNSRLFTCRLISHMTGIEFSRVRTGNYSKEEEVAIQAAIDTVKGTNFTHVYMPMFDPQSIYTAVKKIKHQYGLDVLIVDYFKSSSDGDAFNSYQELGKFVDMVKNTLAGDMGIAALGAVQATSTGKVADSAKIGRNASTIILLQDKSIDEIERDGADCGNKKLRVVLNRNGPQMTSDEYIDLCFNGNKIMYREAKQHTPQKPY